MRRRSVVVVTAAVVAILVAAGGAAAAGHYLITSTHQIKPKVLAALRGDRGSRGPQGPQGIQGPAGPSNTSAITIVTGSQVTIPEYDAEASTATCPTGSHAVSGGAFTDSIDGLNGSEPSDASRDGWTAISSNTYNDGSSTPLPYVQAYALCAGSGAAVTASRREPSAAARLRIDHEVGTLTAQLRLHRH